MSGNPPVTPKGRIIVTSQFVAPVPAEEVPAAYGIEVKLITTEELRHRLAFVILAQSNFAAAEALLARAYTINDPVLTVQFVEHADELVQTIVNEFIGEPQA